jgi:hypothetical protein
MNQEITLEDTVVQVDKGNWIRERGPSCSIEADQGLGVPALQVPSEQHGAPRFIKAFVVGSVNTL